MESLNQEQNWLEKYQNKLYNGKSIIHQSCARLKLVKFVIFSIAANKLKTDNNANVTNQQELSFNFDDDSSDFSSELEEVYEQFSKWLDDPIIKENVEKLDPRDEAVLNFASSLLKRTLSESFVGVPLTDGCISSVCK